MFLVVHVCLTFGRSRTEHQPEWTRMEANVAGSCRMKMFSRLPNSPVAYAVLVVQAGGA